MAQGHHRCPGCPTFQAWVSPATDMWLGGSDTCASAQTHLSSIHNIAAVGRARVLSIPRTTPDPPTAWLLWTEKILRHRVWTSSGFAHCIAVMDRARILSIKSGMAGLPQLSHAAVIFRHPSSVQPHLHPVFLNYQLLSVYEWLGGRKGRAHYSSWDDHPQLGSN